MNVDDAARFVEESEGVLVLVRERERAAIACESREREVALLARRLLGREAAELTDGEAVEEAGRQAVTLLSRGAG